MAQIYNLNGTQVYQDNGQVFNAKTGQVYSPTAPISTPTSPTPLTTPSGYNSQAPITSNDIYNQTPYNFQQPNPTTSTDVSGLQKQLETTYTQTPSEQNQSEISKQLQTINDNLAGKATYGSDLATKAGFVVTQDAQGNAVYNDPTYNDLNTQLGSLINDAKAIPIQLQQQAVGRGITVGGLAPIEAGQLRENAIKALSVSSLMAAQQNKMATAKMYIDQAIYQKYGPDEEKAKALIANLQIIKNDPQTSIDEKKRADQQTLIQNQILSTIAAKKQETADIWTLSTTAAQNTSSFIATPQYATAALALQAIQSASSKEQALAIAQQTGLLKPQTNEPASVAEFKFAQTAAGGNYKGSYTQYQNEDANRKALAMKVSQDPNAVLSVSEAQALGVPFGTTAAQAYGKIPTGTGGQDSTVLKDFSASLVDRKSLDAAGTREQFIRQLIGQYPQIDSNDITRKVYEIYPDNYSKP